MKKRLEFPEIGDAAMAFGDYPPTWFDEALNKVEKEDPVEQKWKDMMEQLFFSGGRVEWNEQLPADYLLRGIKMFKAVIGSFTPKHEHKETVAAHILRSLCEKETK